MTVNVVQITVTDIHVQEMIDKDHVIVIIMMIINDRITDRIDRDMIVDTVIHRIEQQHLLLLVWLIFLRGCLSLNYDLDENREVPKERPRLQLQPRTRPLEDFQALSGSSASINSATAVHSSPSNVDESPNFHESSISHPDAYQRQESHDTSEAGSSLEPLNIKSSAPSRGAGASVFGGAKPVNTAAKELEIERKLQELQMANSESKDEQTERPVQSRYSSIPSIDIDQSFHSYRPNYNRDQHRNNDRDNYRNKRSSHNNDYHRRDDGKIDK